MGRIRELVGVAAVVAALAAMAIGAEPTGATSVGVSNEAGYRSALSLLSADANGPHTIILNGNITVTGGTDPVYSGTQALTIDGNGFALDGGGTRRVLDHATTAALTLTDLTVRNGFSTSSGGAVRSQGPVTLDVTTFEDNIASGTGTIAGGAVRADGDITITDSSFTGNQAVSTNGPGQAGAVSTNLGGSDVVASRSRFADNHVGGGTIGSGGAIRAVGGVSLTDVVVEGNSVTTASGAADGAAVGSGDTVAVLRSSITANTSTATTGAGGALSSSGAAVLIEDSVVAGNTITAPDAYGAAAFSVADLTATNALITGNTANGTGIEVGGLAANSTLTLEHSTLIDNTGATAGNLQASTLAGVGGLVGDPVGGPNCSVSSSTTITRSVADDASCALPGGAAGNAEGVDLGLGPLRGNGDLATDPATPGAPDLLTPFPLAGSPAVDRVPAGQCASDHDLRGVDRPFGGDCDAGAVEQVYPPHGFSDVPPWVEDAIAWITYDDPDDGLPPLAQGFQDGTVRPNNAITRAQVVRLLHRLEQSPVGYPAHGFSDVPGWVEPAVRWAVAEGIADGFDDGTFRPNDPITRAQVTRMVYRVAGVPDVSGIDPHGFSDVPPWVEPAVRWAANPDLPLPLAAGFSGGVFLPNDDITRAQVARMVYRLALTPAAWEDPDQAPGTVPFRVPL